MKNFSKKFASYLSNKNLIAQSDIDLYSYALQVFLQFAITVIFLLLTGLLMNMVTECLLLFSSFYVLRKFCGGLHSKSFIVCLICSTAINLIGLILIAKRWFIEPKVFIIITTISLLLFVILRPVAHPNKVTSNKELRFFKIITMGIATIFYCMFLILYKESSYAYSIATGQIIASIMFVLGKIKYRKFQKQLKDNDM